MDTSQLDNSRKSTRKRGSKDSRVYEPVCIFCSKVSKYLKGKRTRENLVQCVDLRADSAIREAAEKKSDGKVIALCSRELVAAEAKYHRSCYRAYIKDTKQDRKTNDAI